MNNGGVGKKPFQRNESNIEGAFAQKDISEVACYHFGEKRHFARTCPNKKNNSQVQIYVQAIEEELGYIYH